MNIFALDEDPYAAAAYQCDRHVVKMLLETGQILSTVHWLHDYAGVPDRHITSFYKPTHTRHPCVIWAADTYGNYNWLRHHFHGLHVEYGYRFGKEHATFTRLSIAIDHAPTDMGHPDSIQGLTPFALAMPEQYKLIDNPVDAYRAYYKYDKMTKPAMQRYTKRNPPAWLELTTTTTTH